MQGSRLFVSPLAPLAFGTKRYGFASKRSLEHCLEKTKV